MARTRPARSFFLSVALAAAASAPLTAQADDSWELTYDIINLLDAGADGGRFGFRVKQVNGPALMSHNTSGLFGRFYPASTIKVLHHLTAMRWVAQQGDISALYNTQIPVYQNSCSATGDIDFEPLDDVLQAMMVNSNNQRTNAIQDFGPTNQAAINQTAQGVVGMSWETQLNHKFGCGGPANNPANQMTIADLTLLYERYLAGDLLDAGYMDEFEDLMLNEGNSTTWDGLVTWEASQLGLTQAQEDNFVAGFRYAHKGGNWGTTHVSRGGFVELPNRTCKGVVPLQYAYGVFVDEAVDTTAGLINSAAREMLRGEFRNALRTFKPQALFSCIQDIKTLTPDAGGSVTLQPAVGTIVIDI
ncbi:MAG TPA: serine hydrolase, partial [Candidatus Nanopelagicales bacterium]|nr:serine hydrolase [Candidatus Nanopelagicales bacterium]